MTQEETKRVYIDQEKRSKGSKLWITLSFTLSALILGWAFSLPFRQSTAPVDRSNRNFPLPEEIRARRNAAAEFRQAAIALDDEFMRSVREKQEAWNRPRQGIEETRKQWRKRLALVKHEVDELRGAKKGTLEWQHRQSLIESVNDGPR